MTDALRRQPCICPTITQPSVVNQQGLAEPGISEIELSVRCTRRATTRAAFGRWVAPRVYSRGSVKEVIQPQVPLRLPCYDFAPVTTLAFGRLVP